MRVSAFLNDRHGPPFERPNVPHQMGKVLHEPSDQISCVFLVLREFHIAKNQAPKTEYQNVLNDIHKYIHISILYVIIHS